MDNKALLRGRMKALLQGLPEPVPPVHRMVAAWLAARPALQKVALFSALPGEPDLLPLLTSVGGREWCFPRVHGNGVMMLHRVDDARRDLRPGAFGVREPSPDAPEVAVADVDAFLCPGLAFDPQGGRLGRGLGYYDRLLAGARDDARIAGVCFACQRVDNTFAMPHDVRMHEVLCEA